MIQIDIPMPKTCYECPCHDGEYGRCQITGNSYFDEIPRSCPIREIPSTRQEWKKGKWILISDGYVDVCKCDQCGHNSVTEFDYCPHCGARMRKDETMTRKEAREYIIKHCNPHRDTGTQWDDAMECAIKALGEPERKTGKWILHQEQEKNIFDVKTIECSECGDKCLVQCVEKEKYCRNCGAKMEGTE